MMDFTRICGKSWEDVIYKHIVQCCKSSGILSQSDMAYMLQLYGIKIGVKNVESNATLNQDDEGEKCSLST